MDHPRRCGENVDAIVNFDEAIGSPPQVRGKHLRTEFPREADGITPAGAGKTSILLHLGYHVIGSPPQVRGKLLLPKLLQ